MSDRKPKVDVYPDFEGRWQAMCMEPGCTWTHSPDSKTYVEDRARAHRRAHREVAARG